MTTKDFDDLAAAIDADPERSSRAEAYKQEMEAKIFAYQLAELRRELGINQIELARKLGITQGGVSRLERSVDPKLSTICKLTTALGGTLSIEINAGGRTVSLMHPSASPSPPQDDPIEMAPA